MARFLFAFALSFLAIFASAQELHQDTHDESMYRAKYLRYWFDENSSSVRQEGLEEGRHSIDASMLPDGLHTLHYQVVTENGSIAGTHTALFLVDIQEHIGAKSFRYWFDNDASSVKTEATGIGMHTIDASSLSNGLHTLHYQAVAEDGSLQGMYSVTFLAEMCSSKTVGAKGLRYWFDEDAETVKTEEIGIGIHSIDSSMLSDGLHTLHYQIIAEDGSATGTCTTLFLVDTHENVEAKYLRYWFDDAPGSVKTEDIGIGMHTIDVSSLSNGLHCVHYQIIGADGLAYMVQSKVFLMLSEPEALGLNEIVSYEYWVNGNFSDRKKADVTEPSKKILLTALLPLETQPFRSSSFMLDTMGDKLLMYAKNDIHMRFFDALGHWSDDKRSFVDRSVSREVTDVTDLLSTQTFERTTENDVKWFSFYAAPGDTIAFKASQATSIQAFAPSGKEIYAASGDKSVVYGGTHTWEEGTHYLAVHDVMGSKPNITLDYFHMDKYDVVDQDVRIVGNGGCSTITFQGNGFKDLESVTLRKDDFTIASCKIGHEGDATTSVMFDFTDASLGDYRAVFKFKDETKIVNNCVTVEQAVDMAFDLNVSFSNQYLRSTSNTYNINVTNQGNMTAYDFPILIYMFTPESNTLSNVKIGNYDVLGAYKDLLGEYYTEHVADSIVECIQSTGDLYSFVHSINKEYLPGFEHMYAKGITTEIRPYQTETYSVSIQANATAHVYVWCAGDWYPLSMNEEVTTKAKASRKKGCSSIDMARANECINRIEYDLILHPNMDPDCDHLPPSCPQPRRGGSSTPVNSYDPNDIFGYVAESGCRYVGEEVLNLPYRIEFENDTTFASSAAHTVVVRDTLDAKVFDLASYQPTSFKIGDKDVQLKGDKEFVTTVDMRPEINAIAQVEGLYDAKKGIATWLFTSLDPMTMEPTDDIMQGFLPVNYDGRGIGEVAFSINRKPGLPDGTEIANKASIVFDSNDPILTPVWTNIVDAEPPTSRVCDLEVVSDTIVRVNFEGKDYRSGVWKYALYVQYGNGTSWNQVAETDTTCFDFRYYEDIDYGFCVLATDSAGNVEPKIIEREYMFVNGEATMIDAIAAPQEKKAVTNKAYDLSGRLIQEEGYRGIVIRNRRKVLLTKD